MDVLQTNHRFTTRRCRYTGVFASRLLRDSLSLGQALELAVTQCRGLSNTVSWTISPTWAFRIPLTLESWEMCTADELFFVHHGHVLTHHA